MTKRTCICCKQLIHHNSHSVQCSLCHEWSHLRCTQRSKDIKEKTTSWTCNSCCFWPATPRVSVVSLREGSQNLLADSNSQRDREPESDIAAGQCPNFFKRPTTLHKTTQKHPSQRQTKPQDL